MICTIYYHIYCTHFYMYKIYYNTFSLLNMIITKLSNHQFSTVDIFNKEYNH